MQSKYLVKRREEVAIPVQYLAQPKQFISKLFSSNDIKIFDLIDGKRRYVDNKQIFCVEYTVYNSDEIYKCVAKRLHKIAGYSDSYIYEDDGYVILFETPDAHKDFYYRIIPVTEKTVRNQYRIDFYGDIITRNNAFQESVDSDDVVEIDFSKKDEYVDIPNKDTNTEWAEGILGETPIEFITGLDQVKYNAVGYIITLTPVLVPQLYNKPFHLYAPVFRPNPYTVLVTLSKDPLYPIMVDSFMQRLNRDAHAFSLL